MARSAVSARLRSPANKSSLYATPLRTSLAILIVAGLGLFLYEATKSFLLPHLTLWQSHSVTIAFGSVVAAVAAFGALRKQSKLHSQLMYQFSERLKAEADGDALRLSEVAIGISSSNHQRQL